MLTLTVSASIVRLLMCMPCSKAAVALAVQPSSATPQPRSVAVEVAELEEASAMAARE